MQKARAGARQTSKPNASGTRGAIIGATLVAGAALACGRIDLGSQMLGGKEPEPPADLPSSAEMPPGSTGLPSDHTTTRPGGELPSAGSGPGNGPAPHEALPDASASPPIGGDASALDAGASTPPLTPDLGPPSCRGATEFCGPDKDDCCLSLPVEGGAISLPVANSARARVTVSSFRLDRYEVTVGRFRAFLDGYDEWYQSGARLPEPDILPPEPDAGTQSSRADAGTFVPLRPAEPLPRDAAELERRVRECDTIPLSTLDLPNSSSRIPLNCVDWLEAAAFCAWDGGRLPTYAEWYYAAVGGAQERLYPWGNEPTPSRVYAAYGCSLGVERPECTAAYVLPVGSHPAGAGLFGQQDLAGSMTEWLHDGAFDHYVDGCVDCAGPPVPVLRFWRGGSWVDEPSLLQSHYAVLAEQRLRLPFLGLRCARDLER